MVCTVVVVHPSRPAHDERCGSPFGVVVLDNHSTGGREGAVRRGLERPPTSIIRGRGTLPPSRVYRTEPGPALLPPRLFHIDISFSYICESAVTFCNIVSLRILTHHFKTLMYTYKVYVHIYINFLYKIEKVKKFNHSVL